MYENRPIPIFIHFNAFTCLFIRNCLILYMAKLNSFRFTGSNSRKRPGIHAKSKSSKLTSSKNYVKKYRGQGR